ncbi:MAG: M1 family metallopeptidase [Flavobacteriaceae bacterium]|nr:M1 family metallopeptidase [Flavobacteriaceae bacterium]
MTKFKYLLLLLPLAIFSQEKAHYNLHKFRQLAQELPSPNSEHTASGAPGHDYKQQQVDYVMDIVLDEKNNKLIGTETITYHNNSDDTLTYLWVQLDQNKRRKNSKTQAISPGKIAALMSPKDFSKHFIDPFDGGFNIVSVKDSNKRQLEYQINYTMMRIQIPRPLKAGEHFVFTIDWWYHINNFVEEKGRSGYEHFPKDGNNLYIIAQFFPRLAVYNNVEGWQHQQFWGRSEWALEFGNYQVNITVPSDHILDGTGKLTNRKEVFTPLQLKRYKMAMNSYTTPVIISNQEEIILKEKTTSTQTKTWKLEATNVRDFAFASSRKFIFDAMAVDIQGKRVMAHSLYPKEGNPLWEQYSTKAIKIALESYSDYTFDYPYHKAISVHAKNQGMEYPMICWNRGRPNQDGTYSQRIKQKMISVIIHEVGHNFFPMIVNSDERQWTWMDEGLNSFLQYFAEQRWEKGYPAKRGPAYKIVGYMSGDQSKIAPIMCKADDSYQFASNAYAKPATALHILRNLVMGPELFDHAFKTYSKRWMFKHPTPADFFRTMEDASAMDLDWFWRGWFYTTDVVDIGIKSVKSYAFITEKNNSNKAITILRKEMKFSDPMDEKEITNNYNLTTTTTSSRLPNYAYEIEFIKPGGLIMPIIVQYIFTDNSSERVVYPAEVWRKNEFKFIKTYTSYKKLKQILLDPALESADINTSNNYWPVQNSSKFDRFKNK